jgi:hypothetical protein
LPIHLDFLFSWGPLFSCHPHTSPNRFVLFPWHFASEANVILARSAMVFRIIYTKKTFAAHFGVANTTFSHSILSKILIVIPRLVTQMTFKHGYFCTSIHFVLGCFVFVYLNAFSSIGSNHSSQFELPFLILF